MPTMTNREKNERTNVSDAITEMRNENREYSGRINPALYWPPGGTHHIENRPSKSGGATVYRQCARGREAASEIPAVTSEIGPSTSFHHQPEAQHPKSSAIHKLPADLPYLFGRYWGRADMWQRPPKR